MIWILLGPPGVGKGTQAVALAADAQLRHLSTGDMLRAHRREGTDLGRQAQAVMDRGELVSDDIILGMVREELESGAADRGVVFDGFPRTIPQAEGLDRLLHDLGRPLSGVIVLGADDEVLVKRMSGRRSCGECGSVFNVHFNPPAVDGICDTCGASLVHRADDAPETVRNRLEVYRELTEPLIEFYRSHAAPLHTVDGTQSVEQVRVGVQAVISGEFSDRSTV